MILKSGIRGSVSEIVIIINEAAFHVDQNGTDGVDLFSHLGTTGFLFIFGGKITYVDSQLEVDAVAQEFHSVRLHAVDQDDEVQFLVRGVEEVPFDVTHGLTYLVDLEKKWTKFISTELPLP